VDVTRVILVRYYFTGLLQRIFNTDEIQDTDLTPDDWQNG